MTRLRTVLSIAAIALGFAGCGPDKPPPTTAAAPPEPPKKQLTPEQDTAVSEAEKEVGPTGLGIEDEILRLCPAVKPPRFAYDSAKVREEFRDALVELAKCMNEGALKDRSLLLVGHADPRGEEDYNLALGGRRADSVRGALGSLGVDQARLDVSSRGELDARGEEESGWAKDRRVDIKLKVN